MTHIPEIYSHMMATAELKCICVNATESQDEGMRKEVDVHDKGSLSNTNVFNGALSIYIKLKCTPILSTERKRSRPSAEKVFIFTPPLIYKLSLPGENLLSGYF